MAEHDPWKQIDEALGIGGVDAATVALFDEAGFDDEQARRGAAMMASGRYFGFADVATSLAMDGGRTVSPVQEARIAEVAHRLEGGASSSDAGRGAKVSIDEDDYQRLLTKGDRLRELEAENARLKSERQGLVEARATGTVSWDDIDAILGLGGDAS